MGAAFGASCVERLSDAASMSDDGDGERPAPAPPDAGEAPPGAGRWSGAGNVAAPAGYVAAPAGYDAAPAGYDAPSGVLATSGVRTIEIKDSRGRGVIFQAT